MVYSQHWEGDVCRHCRYYILHNITYYLTVTDSYGDGWTNNILAFRQNGAFQTFGLPWGYSAGPFAFSFIRNVIVDIIVYTLGSYTK